MMHFQILILSISLCLGNVSNICFESRHFYLSKFASFSPNPANKLPFKFSPCCSPLESKRACVCACAFDKGHLQYLAQLLVSVATSVLLGWMLDLHA